jgi:uncharacterized protein
MGLLYLRFWQFLRQSYQRLTRQIRYAKGYLQRTEASPRFLARGMAVGVFIGCFPFFGLQIVFSVCLAALLRGSKVLAAAGTWISNPFTSIPLYLFNYEVGRVLLGQSRSLKTLVELSSWRSLMQTSSDLMISLIVGSFLVGGIAGLASYGLTLRLVRRWRKH